MNKLVRHVRFSVNPFLATDAGGFNAYASKPAGEGLAVFLELSVGLVGEVESDTGFIVNATDIDKNVRQYIVPVFAERIRRDFRESKHISFFDIAELLRSAQKLLADKFGKAILSELSLKLNPFRKAAIDCEDYKMVYFSEKFEFAATHKLWNKQFSEKRNLQIFGKCANPSGHGHNYIAEVTVKIPTDKNDFHISEFQAVVDKEFIKLVDHKNLNIDVADFAEVNPTVENIAVFAWNRLNNKFNKAILHCVTVWETDKTYCSYYG